MPDAQEFFAHVPTTAIADVSVLLGLSLIMEGIQPLEPLTSAHMAAPATTLQFVPAQDPTTPRVSLYDVLEDLSPGTCVVVGAGGLPLAVLGANGARVAARRGAVGAVVDGAVRDVRALHAMSQSPVVACRWPLVTSSSPMPTESPWCHRAGQPRSASVQRRLWPWRKRLPRDFSGGSRRGCSYA
jgi:regulator of RNase E activity RraA